MTVRVEVDPPISPALAAQIVRLHAEAWPGTGLTTEDVLDRQADEQWHVVLAFADDGLVGMAQLIDTRSLRRLALLYEELVITEAARTTLPFLPWLIDAEVLRWARTQYPVGTRIEGSVDSRTGLALWTVHLRSGFEDRHQRSFVVTL